MSILEKIDRYVESAGLPETLYDRYGIGMAEYDALMDTVSMEYAVLTAYEYGLAKGYRAGQQKGFRDGK